MSCWGLREEVWDTAHEMALQSLSIYLTSQSIVHTAVSKMDPRSTTWSQSPQRPFLIPTSVPRGNPLGHCLASRQTPGSAVLSGATWNPEKPDVSVRTKSKGPPNKDAGVHTNSTASSPQPLFKPEPALQYPKWPNTKLLLLYMEVTFLLDISKNFLSPLDWLCILSVIFLLPSILQPLPPCSKQFHANLLRFLWGMVGNRTLLSNGTSTSIWHPSWHFTLHIIIYSVMYFFSYHAIT